MLINQKITKVVLLCFMAFTTMIAASNLYACEARLQSIDLINSNVRSYDVFSSEAFALTQQYEVKAIFTEDPNLENCSFYVAVSTFDTNRQMVSINNESLVFEPNPQSSISGIQHNYWYGQVTPRNDKFRFQLRFPGKQFASQGNYSALLEAKLLPSLTSANVLDEITQAVTTKIDSAVKISFYGLADNNYHLNLGELTTGKVVDLSPHLYIKSTSGYSLSFDSINKGHLRHQNQLAKWDIDYQLTMNSSEIDLNQNSRQFYSNYSTGAGGDRMPLKIIVGDTEMKPGGKYTDEVHIYVTPSGIVSE
jgi:hypothetical protein